MYKIFETKQFTKDLQYLAKSSLSKVEKKLTEYIYTQLKQEPHFGLNIKKLKGWNPDTWRYRVGNWRFFYEIDEEKKIVFMTAIENRGSAY